MIHDLHFLILTCLYKNQFFLLALPSEVFAIEELCSIAQSFIPTLSVVNSVTRQIYVQLGH